MGLLSVKLKDGRPRSVEVKPGERFVRWTVTGERWARIDGHARRLINCRCDCGTIREIVLSRLTRGLTQSCGCLAREMNSTRMRRHGEASARTKEFRAWEAAKGRCFNPRNPKYPRYGGRGIGMCARWRGDFSAFLSDMGRKPSGTTLDRIDNDGNYEPGNCRWATPKVQAQNTIQFMPINFRGEIMGMADFAKLFGRHPETVRYHLNKGRSPEEISRRWSLKIQTWAFMP